MLSSVNKQNHGIFYTIFLCQLGCFFILNCIGGSNVSLLEKNKSGDYDSSKVAVDSDDAKSCVWLARMDSSSP